MNQLNITDLVFIDFHNA